jgi:DNA-binding MarR family transcriptional regulator
LREKNRHCFLHLNDIDKISSIFCDFKEESGRKLRRDIKLRKDRFRSYMKEFEKKELLEKVGDGTDYKKKFIKYEVKNMEIWDSLKMNYSIQRNTPMVIWTFTF